MSNSITRTYTFANGGTADGGQVDSEIANIVNTINNADAGTTAWTIVNAATFKRSGNTVLTIQQVLQGTQTATPTTTSSASFVTTGTTVTITPTSTSSKILILASGVLKTNRADHVAYATLARAGTNLGDATTGMSTVGGDGLTTFGDTVPCSMVYLDSPATVSSILYAVYFRIDSASFTASWGGVQCQIAVIEIL